ncbi:MAG: hypothetical protein AAGC60_03615 [Acidobacteriota bacterium]
MAPTTRLTASLALFVAPFFTVADEARRSDSPDLHALVATMTLEEKIGQLALRGRGSSRSTEPLPDELIKAVRAGRVGSRFTHPDHPDCAVGESIESRIYLPAVTRWGGTQH